MKNKVLTFCPDFVMLIGMDEENQSQESAQQDPKKERIDELDVMGVLLFRLGNNIIAAVKKLFSSKKPRE